MLSKYPLCLTLKIAIYFADKIFEKAHELNFEPFSAWVKRKVKAQRLKAQALGIDLPKNENEASGNPSAD